ncbi:MAG: hypothetical protein P8076_04390 [Gammaproteobacteria bacterium]
MSMSISSATAAQALQRPANNERHEVREHDHDADDQLKAQQANHGARAEESRDAPGAADEADGNVGRHVNTHA